MAKKITGELAPPGRGRLPSLEGLVDKSPAQLMRTLERFGLEPDLKEFERTARRVYEQQLEAAIERAGFPDEDTWAAIDEQLRRASVQVLRRQTKRAVHRYRKERLREVAKYFVWVAVGKGSCPSCEKRHGQRRTMRQWEALGEPGSSVLICQQECRCSLLPDVVGQSAEDAAITEAVDRAVDELGRVEIVKK